MMKKVSAQVFELLPSIISIILISLYFLFFYIYLISIKDVVISIGYFIVAVITPGCIMSVCFYKMYSSIPQQRMKWYLEMPIITVLGLFNILLSYLLGQIVHKIFFCLLVIVPYLFLLIKSIRKSIQEYICKFFRKNNIVNNWSSTIIIFYVFIVTVLFLLIRPTPGILPLDIYYDHLWNVGNTVSLVNEFPLRSLNIDLKPHLAYHILIHIMGAHMAIVTGLKAHLVGLQYVFIPLVPLLVLNMAALLIGLKKIDNGYLLYGLAVLLFGGGFTIVHEVKVNSLLQSNTNFLGIIMLFSIVSILIHNKRFTKMGRLTLLCLCLFTATVAKGSIGAALLGGVALAFIRSIFKGDNLYCAAIDFSGALMGFIISFVIFFIMPTWDQNTSSLIYGSKGYPIIPLSYVLKNALLRPVTDVIYSYLTMPYQVIASLILIIITLPIYVLLYFSYRLLIFLDFKMLISDYKYMIMFMIIIISVVVTYSLNAIPQSNAYFLLPALYLLDVLFIVYIINKKIFTIMKEYYCTKQIYALIGVVFVIMLPFISAYGGIREEFTKNFFMYGKIGQLMDDKIRNTSYRKSRETISPSLYHAFQYVRENTEQGVVVVSPFVSLPDGRDLSFFTSAFTERVVYLEGYVYGGVIDYVGQNEIDKRKREIEKIYKEYTFSNDMMNDKYIFISKNETISKVQSKYILRILYENSDWSVFQVVNHSK